MLKRLKKICSAAVLMFLGSFCFGGEGFRLTGSGNVFKLDPLTDGVLMGTGLLLSGGDLILDNILEINRVEYKGEVYSKNSVNEFDRTFMREYSDTGDKLSNISMAALLASPVVFLATDKDEWFTEGLMYAETLLIANGMKEMIKLAVNRKRPYMYYDSENWNSDDIKNGDFANSFLSGHTTMAFASATFTSYAFSKYFSDSKWKYAVTGGCYGLAAGTAALRIYSGNHFMTDVICGAVLGTATGFLVPWLHTFNAGHDLNVALTGNGINFTVKL